MVRVGICYSEEIPGFGIRSRVMPLSYRIGLFYCAAYAYRFEGLSSKRESQN